MNNIPKEVPKGFFKQELHEGDRVVVMLRSYGSHYLRECTIHSITYTKGHRAVRDAQGNYVRDPNTKYGYINEEVLVPTVKIAYQKEYKKWIYDRISQTGHYSDPVIKQRVSRIYNYTSAITL